MDFSLSNTLIAKPEFLDLWSLIDSLRFFESARLMGIIALIAGTKIPIDIASKLASPVGKGVASKFTSPELYVKYSRGTDATNPSTKAGRTNNTA